jgi:FtsP/CotA-like multicopper oxidase with cupredoxin domain
MTSRLDRRELLCRANAAAAVFIGADALAPLTASAASDQVESETDARSESAVDAQARTYWIAAVPVRWNIVPNGHDAIMGMEFTRKETTLRTVVYKAFTPGWGEPLKSVSSVVGDEDGIPGPTIQARVGEKIVVHFKNLDTEFNRPHTMHFHGVEYDFFDSDGAFIPGFSGPGASVEPGDTHTYELVAGPDSAGVWPYHDHGPAMEESIRGGMYGALSIRDAGESVPDREFVVFLEHLAGFSTINGRAFVGNTPVFHANVGDVVQWDVLALGDDFHTFHIHGHRWRDPSGTPIDTRVVGPAESFRFRFREDKPGTWLYHCHVETHMAMGMIGIYVVKR